uniref:Uncharacterized protein n=1 Tax=Tanacetum cinerariifolium TaxID=118510 RepID=A0A6L2N7L3_TANCI|nr:hypothetical protein [Tanacetum cinerariifolium]
MVIIHIDYDYALDVLIYLMADESDKNDDIKKKKLSLEQQETEQNTDIEKKNKGMPASKKMDLRRGQPRYSESDKRDCVPVWMLAETICDRTN